MTTTTWDGLPVSREPPYGATVVVFRRAADGVELLLLHRAIEGPDYAGDWAWTPPAGARLPGEPIERCARRELREEAGLDLEVTRTECGSVDWPLFLVEVPPDAEVTLDAEHDRYEWVSCQDALGRCRPDRARGPLRSAVQVIRRER
jgi:8-oxo-dGTP pyrophosphatase MutT (NUDIX family)